MDSKQEITLDYLVKNFDSVLNALKEANNNPEKALDVLAQIGWLVYGIDQMRLDDFDQFYEDCSNKYGNMPNKEEFSNIIGIVAHILNENSLPWISFTDATEYYRIYADNDSEITRLENEDTPESKRDLEKARFKKEFLDEFSKRSSLSGDVTFNTSSIVNIFNAQVMKTDIIRKNLNQRINNGEADPDKIKDFYNIGVDKANRIYNETQKSKEELEKIYKEIVEIYNEMNKQENASDPDKREEALKKIWEKLSNVEQFKEQLNITDKDGNDVDFFVTNPDFKDQEIDEFFSRVVIERDFLRDYYPRAINDYEEIMEEQEENRMIFQRELDIFDMEIEGQNVYDEWYDDNGELKDEKKAEFEEELKIRKKQIDVFFGKDDDEYKIKWNETVERFCKCRDESDEVSIIRTYIDENGIKTDIELKFKTIDKDKYPTNNDEEDGPVATQSDEQYEKDIRFLNIREYKKYLELTSLFENLGKNDGLDRNQKLDLMQKLVEQHQLDDLAPELFIKFREKEIEKRGSGKEWLDTYLGECKEYVTTFNGFTNQYAVQSAVLGTAGSMMKAMEPIKGDLPVNQKVERGLRNFGRFLGFRFIEKGMSTREMASIVAMNFVKTVGIAGIIGGAAAGFAVGSAVGVGMAITGASYYIAKGTVWLANLGDKYFLDKKYKKQIDSNLPTLTKATKREKEVMRRHYYMSEKKMGPIRAWVKAKADRVIKKQRETTEQEIRDDKVVAIYLSERDRAEQIKKNKELADENQVKRKKNIEAIANSAKTYNDIYRDPFVIANADRNEADIAYKNAVQNVVLNAALQSHGKKRMSINPKAGYEYYDKFTKENEPDLEKTEVLGEVKKDSAAIPVMTIAQKFKAQQESQDFLNNLAISLLTVGIRNLGKVFIQKDFIIEREHKSKETEHTYKHRVEEAKVDDTSQNVPEIPDDPTPPPSDPKSPDISKTISDLKYSKETYLHTYGADVYDKVDLQQNSIDGFAITYNGPNGVCSLSIGEGATGFTNEHVQTVLENEDISGWSVEKVLNTMVERNPEGFKEYLRVTGLDKEVMNGDTINVKAFFMKVLREPDKYGKVYGQNRLTGWRELVVPPEAKEMSHGITEHVLGATETVANGAKNLTDAQIQFTYNTVEDVSKYVGHVDKGLDSVGLGVGVAAVDSLTEAINPTYRVKKGTFEEENPNLEGNGNLTKETDENIDIQDGNERDLFNSPSPNPSPSPSPDGPDGPDDDDYIM